MTLKKNIIPAELSLDEIQRRLASLQGLTLDDVIGSKTVALSPSAAPTRPKSGFLIFTDVTDGRLKAIDSRGVVTALTLPTASGSIDFVDVAQAITAVKTFTATPIFAHITVEGVTSTGATGLGKLVFDTSPTLTGNVTFPGSGVWNSSGNVGIGTGTVSLTNIQLTVMGVTSDATQYATVWRNSGVTAIGWVRNDGTAYFGSSLGIGVTPSYTFDVNGSARVNGHFYLADGAVVGLAGGSSFATYIARPAAGTDAIVLYTGGYVRPGATFTSDLGTDTIRWRSLYAAELRVQTLIAQKTIATIGGRILVGPTCKLTADVAAAATTITVDNNQMSNGDIVYLESAPGGVQQIEYMAIASAATGTGPYTYTVTRNLDGTGADNWKAGDAVFNTGQAGNGFIDLYSVRGTKASTELGPTIVGNVRNSSTFNDWSPRWAIGNLNGLYGYATDTYGCAFGVPTGAWVKIDPTSGVRIGFNATTNVQIDASGNASFSGSITASSGTIGGFTIGATELYAGTGATRVEMQSSGGFWAGATTFAGAPFSVSPAGVLTTTSGTIGGWTIGATEIAGTTGKVIRAGQASYNNGTGFWMGHDGASYKFSIGSSASSKYLLWDGSKMVLRTANVWFDEDFGGGIGGVSVSGTTAELRVSAGVGGANAGGLRYGTAGPELYAAAAATPHIYLTVASGGVIYLTGTTATTVGAAGVAAALPANPVGYLQVGVGGAAYKIPYYNV